MSDTSNEVEYEYRPGTFTTTVEALKSYCRDLQELVERKCREDMARSLYKELNKQEESKWDVYDTLARELLFLKVERPLAVRFSIGSENVEFSSN